MFVDVPNLELIHVDLAVEVNIDASLCLRCKTALPTIRGFLYSPAGSRVIWLSHTPYVVWLDRCGGVKENCKLGPTGRHEAGSDRRRDPLRV